MIWLINAVCDIFIMILDAVFEVFKFNTQIKKLDEINENIKNTKGGKRRAKCWINIEEEGEIPTHTNFVLCRDGAGNQFKAKCVDYASKKHPNGLWLDEDHEERDVVEWLYG